MGSMSFADMRTFGFLKVLKVYEDVIDPAEWLAELPKWFEDYRLGDFDVYMLAGSVDFKRELMGKEVEIVKKYGIPIEDIDTYLGILVWNGRTPASLELLPFMFRSIDRQKFMLYHANSDVIIMDNETEELLVVKGDTSDVQLERCKIGNIVAVMGMACGEDTDKGRQARQLFCEISRKLIGRT